MNALISDLHNLRHNHTEFANFAVLVAVTVKAGVFTRGDVGSGVSDEIQDWIVLLKSKDIFWIQG